MAFDEANAVRQPGELPFEVIAKADSPQWGSAANIAVEFSDTNALAFLGTIDGDATHVALRAVLKLEMLMVNCSNPNPSLTETPGSWLLRDFPDNRQQGYLLARLIVEERGLTNIVVLAATACRAAWASGPLWMPCAGSAIPCCRKSISRTATAPSTPRLPSSNRPSQAVVFWGNAAETGPAASMRSAG